jgi:hypothetical protein
MQQDRSSSDDATPRVVGKKRHRIEESGASKCCNGRKRLGQDTGQSAKGFPGGGTRGDGLSVVSVDGFAIASELPVSVEERLVSAMAAAMLALGEQTANEFEHGGLERVFVEGADGYTILTSAG